MYREFAIVNGEYKHGVEDSCFKEEHLEKVVQKIVANFDEYYTGLVAYYIKKNNKNYAEDREYQKLRQDKNYVEQQALKTFYSEAVLKGLEENREKYLKIMDRYFLDEYEDYPKDFKDYFRDNCPIVQRAYYRSKVNNTYRLNYTRCDENALLYTISSIFNYAQDYEGEHDCQESFLDMYDMGFEGIDSDHGCQLRTVIGVHIMSRLLYKYNPSLYPNCSKEALWALYFLTDKETFGCRYDSEFLMIWVNKNETGANFLYRYQLFAWYAYNVSELLFKKGLEAGLLFDARDKYALVDGFFNFIYKENEDAIECIENHKHPKRGKKKEK